MVDSLVIQEISEDVHFRKLVKDDTASEEFRALLEEHVRGYSQKKRLYDGIKEFIKRVEDAENRLFVARNVGKFKAPDPEDTRLTDSSSSFALKEKAQELNALLESMISVGSITYAEKPVVLENLRTRIAKAKEAGKEKLEEKLKKMVESVAGAHGFSLPVANIEEFYQLDTELHAIAKLEKLNSKNLSDSLREQIANKVKIQNAFDELIDSSRMWFEIVLEFKPRLSEAMTKYTAEADERKRKAEEDAFEKKRQEEQEAFDRKQAEAERKREEAAKMLEEKLQAKRAEAAAKPVKEAPKAKPKEKKAVATVDIKSLFRDEIESAARERESHEPSADEVQAFLEEEARLRELAKKHAEIKQAIQEVEAAKRERAIQETKAAKQAEREKLKKVAELKAETQKLSKPKEKEKEAEPAKHTKTAEEKQAEEERKLKAIEEKLAAKRLEAESKPKKEVKEPPKKKEKTQTKINLLDLFAGEDPVLEKLAAQAAQEKVEREAAEKEAARQLAEEEAAWAAEEEEGCVEQNATTGTVLIESGGVPPKPEAPPKPARKPPVEIESKWGVPAVPAEVAAAEDGDMPSLADSMPSLADAAKAPAKKTPAPLPKKKQKKAWGKVDASLLGFDADNPNL